LRRGKQNHRSWRERKQTTIALTGFCFSGDCKDVASIFEKMTDRFYRNLFWRFFRYKSLKGYLALLSGCFLPPPSTNPYLYQPPPPSNTPFSPQQQEAGSATREVHPSYQPANTTFSPNNSTAPKKKRGDRLPK
jgi:hypothetical protein